MYRKKNNLSNEEIIFMMKVKSLQGFEKSVLNMAKQQNANLFHCYVTGDIFKIATRR